ncbi:TetR/AcrR family transcriptional regulator [Rubrobacter taiwanensis]|jgi:AcrR family transcriptional regulator|uniref:TetR/AcrR family transcriptional regulator n=1 Tax=Rubrobacter taiwanensis TaxID=185139 RepID=A0A4R1BR89_9ACTN|nr:TetR/AcrR family transcriptional regulator [Rubrobacter taiwanensis]
MEHRCVTGSSRGEEGTRERVLGVALRLFAERGYEATGIRSIAAGVGITPAGLYHYAASKEEILLALMERGLERLISAARRALEDLESPEERLAALAYLHVLSHGRRRLLHLVNDTEFRVLGGENRARIGARRDEYEAYWREVIRRGVVEGVFRVDDVRLAGFALLQMCTGVAQWYSPEGGLSIEEISARFADMALALVRAERDGGPVRFAELGLAGLARYAEEGAPWECGVG